jgi:hypothetical protein
MTSEVIFSGYIRGEIPDGIISERAGWVIRVRVFLLLINLFCQLIRRIDGIQKQPPLQSQLIWPGRIPQYRLATNNIMGSEKDTEYKP